MSHRPEAAGEAARPRVILGLGNPGPRYADTRHNVGFRVLDELARRHGAPLEGDTCRARSARLTLAPAAEARTGDGVAGDGRTEVLLAAPQTYMNRSGHTARCLVERHDLEAADFLVVYDEVHLPLGTLRLRPGGSPAGHRGMESVLESLGTDRVARLRLGVAAADVPPPGDELVGFVLAPFAADEAPRVERMVRRAADACETWARDGAEAAMQRWNGPTPEPDEEAATGSRTP